MLSNFDVEIIKFWELEKVREKSMYLIWNMHDKNNNDLTAIMLHYMDFAICVGLSICPSILQLVVLILVLAIGSLR